MSMSVVSIDVSNIKRQKSYIYYSKKNLSSLTFMGKIGMLFGMQLQG